MAALYPLSCSRSIADLASSGRITISTSLNHALPFVLLLRMRHRGQSFETRAGEAALLENGQRVYPALQAPAGLDECRENQLLDIGAAWTG